MARRLLTLLSAASLLLWVATCVRWVRSHGPKDSVEFGTAGSRWRVLSSHGRLSVDDQPQVDADDAEDRRRRKDSRRRERAVDAELLAMSEANDRRHEDFEVRYASLDSLSPKRVPLLPKLQYWVLTLRLECQRILSEQDFADQEKFWAAYAVVRAEHSRLSDEALNAINSRSVSYGRDVRHAWLAGGLAVLPIAWMARCVARYHRKRRRRNVGGCPACGYDLRATPGRCPECGAGTRGAAA